MHVLARQGLDGDDDDDDDGGCTGKTKTKYTPKGTLRSGHEEWGGGGSGAGGVECTSSKGLLFRCCFGGGSDTFVGGELTPNAGHMKK